MTTIVNGLAEEYEGTLECKVLDATAEESVAKIKEYGFGNHGLVIFDAEDNVKWKKDGHMMREPEIRAALTEVLQE